MKKNKKIKQKGSISKIFDSRDICKDENGNENLVCRVGLSRRLT